jgi:hypothetical protein
MRTKSELRLMIADREVSFCDEDILRAHTPTQLHSQFRTQGMGNRFILVRWN